MPGWTGPNYPTSLDSAANMPPIVNGQQADDADFNILRDAVVEVEKKAGSNLIEQDSVRHWLMYGVETDTPPASPSIYNDEFPGPTLDPSWGWYYKGEPNQVDAVNGYYESYGITNERLWIVTIQDSGNNLTDPHVLLKACPAPAVKWSATIKVCGTYYDYYNQWSIFCDNGGTTRLIRLSLCMDNAQRAFLGTSWYEGAWTYDQWKRYISCKYAYLRLVWDATRFAALSSPDGIHWFLHGYKTPGGGGWTPGRFGLQQMTNDNAVGERCGEFEFFRVVIVP